MTSLVAPARYVYRGVAHRRGADQPTDEHVDGWTACGRPMFADELWRDVPPGDVEAVCRDCETPDRAHDEELTLL